MLVLILVVLLCSFVQSEVLPENWKVCKIKDDAERHKCLVEAVKIAFEDLLDGNEKLNEPPLEPLQMGTIEIFQPTGPVSLKFIFHNLQAANINKFEIKNFSTNWKDQLHLEVKFLKPVVITGDYSVEGKILLLPLQGKGSATTTFYDYDAKMDQTAEIITKNGEKYFHIKNSNLNFDVSLASIQLDNLFNGNKQLGDNMNTFMNKNWKLMLTELKKPIRRSSGPVLGGIIAKIMEKIPLSEIAPDV